MAGVRVEIQLDDKAVQAALQQALDALGPNGLAPLLGELGEYLLGTTRDRAAEEIDPNGMPWAALSPRYAQRKAQKRPGLGLLHFDNHMLGDRLAWQISGDTLYLGTSVPYGARQQFGGGGIPARPWLGVSATDAEGVQARTMDFLREVLDEASSG